MFYFQLTGPACTADSGLGLLPLNLGIVFHLSQPGFKSSLQADAGERGENKDISFTKLCGITDSGKVLKKFKKKLIEISIEGCIIIMCIFRKTQPP